MTTRLLVLGGSGFVGGALLAEGFARGWEVTTFNRGQRRPADIVGDRNNPATLTALTRRDWDIVADTWSGAPRAVRDSAAALAGRVGRYVYISSGSAGIEEWSELPLWLPPGHPIEGLLGMDTERAHAAGLRCRPVAETVAGTWQWMSSLPGPPTLRGDLPAPGLPLAKERAALHHL